MCHEYGDLDLSPLRNLQSLRWRAVHLKDVVALSLTIRVNRAHLRTLELDFVDWAKFLAQLDLSSDDEDANDESTSIANSYFADRVLGLHTRQPQLFFPQLRTLDLTQVPLVAAMAHAINFDTLRKLTLCMCPGWCDFVQAVLNLGAPLRLTTLELQETDSVSDEFGEFIAKDFISGFEGLEELFLSQNGIETLRLWNTIARCHPSLRRFVYHPGTVNLNEESPYFEEECDLNDLAIVGRERRILKEDPFRNNPLARLNLESIGLCCRPERLVSITCASLMGKWSSNQVM